MIAPKATIEWPRTRVPEVSIRRHDRYDAFVMDARSRPAISAAIVHPCSPEAILAAVEVRDEGLFEPVLVGPEAKIRAAAEVAQVSLDGMAFDEVLGGCGAFIDLRRENLYYGFDTRNGQLSAPRKSPAFYFSC